MAEAHDRITLAFRDAELERGYRQQTADGVRRAYRFWSATAWIGSVALWFADPIMGNPEILRTYRLAIGLPLGALVVAFGYAPARWFRRAWAQVWFAGVVAMTLVPIAAISRLPAAAQIDPGPWLISLVSILIGSCMVLPVRFVNALVATVVVVAAVAAWISTQRGGAAGLVIWFVVGATIAVFGARQLEARHREAFAATWRLDLEHARSERLLRNVLPDRIAQRLKDGAPWIADRFDDVTVLFADLVGFTSLSATLDAERLVELLNQVFTRFDELAAHHRIEKIKTIGDAYMVVAGLPEPRADHADAAAEIALDLRAAIAEIGRATGRA